MSTNLQGATAMRRTHAFALPSSSFSKFFSCMSLLVAFLFATNVASAQITYTWTNTSGDKAWTNALNWFPPRAVTANSDIIVINNGLMDTIINIPTQTIGKLNISNNTEVVLMGGMGNSYLTVANTAGTDMTLESGSSLTFDGSLEQLRVGAGAEVDISGDLTVIDGSFRLNLANSITTVTGRLMTIGSGTVAGPSITKLFFAAGSTYEHARNGGSIPTANWNAASTCEVTGVIVGTPGNLNQTFGNFIWNCPGQTGNPTLTTTTILGDLTIIDTGNDPDPGTEELRMNQALLTVGGNFIQSGGSFRVSNGTSSRTLRVAGSFELSGGRFLLNQGSGSSTGTLQIGGDFTYGAGSMFVESNTNVNGLGAVIFAGNTTYTDGGTLTGNVNFTVQSGALLQMAADNTIVPGSGTFLLQTTSTLGITSPAGITTSGATGNIQVTGARTYNTNAHYLYNGGGAQVTGNGLPVLIDSLTIDNAGSGLTLSQSLAIQSAVIFETGVIYTSSLPEVLLAFGPGAVATGASQDSYVDGPVVKGGMEAFDFPIGDGGVFAPLGISAPSVFTDVFRAEYFRANPVNEVSGAVDGVDVFGIIRTGYWDLNRVNGVSAVSITLNWDGNDEAMMDDVDALLVVHYDGMQWTSAGGTATGAPDVGGTVVSDPVNSFSFFTIGSNMAMNPLPIELVSFTATPKASEVLLNWRTATEIDNNYFSVERSNNGRDFAEIGKVNGAGTSYIALDYALNDSAPLQGWNYYRLKQVDFDGQFTYSPIQAVLMGKSEVALHFTLFPNPAHNELNLKTDRLLQANDRVEIFDYTGRLVQSFSATDAGETMNISNLSAGTYVVRLRTASGISTTSFVKQ